MGGDISVIAAELAKAGGIRKIYCKMKRFNIGLIFNHPIQVLSLCVILLRFAK